MTTNIDSKEMYLLNNCKPELVAGEYKVYANLDITMVDDTERTDDKISTEFHTSEKTFFVDAPRFTLTPADVYSTYPADNQVSNFSDTIPHIVFKRRTLPWERQVFAGDDAPWIYLLLIKEADEPHINRITYPLKDLEAAIKIRKEQSKNPGGATVKVDFLLPEIDLQAWELSSRKGNEEKQLDMLEVKASLLNKILPPKKSLPYLAHVRKVETDSTKEQASITDLSTTGTSKTDKKFAYFSTLVCSQHVPPNKNDKAEKYTVYAVSAEGYGNLWEKLPSLDTPARFFVLHSWSFFHQKGETFFEVCNRINPDFLTLRNEGLLKYGYVPLKHHTRNGAAVVSLYKGPLSAYFVPFRPKTKLYSSADEALRFDKETGLFDVSYAAAWQLGRLLALKDREYCTQLYKWQQGHFFHGQRQYRKDQVQAILDKKPGNLLEVKTDSGFSLEDLMIAYCNTPPGGAPRPQPVNPTAGLTLPPDMIMQRLKDWALLQSVPLNYLIPDEKLLPPDSLRVFAPDSSWIDAMLCGALSICSSSFSSSILNNVRSSGYSVYTLHSGFFLRSQLVRGWKGVEIQAKGIDGAVLIPARLEIIHNDILLCFFDRKVTSVSIVQPAESLFFSIGAGSEANGRTLAEIIDNDVHVQGSSAGLARYLMTKPINYTFTVNTGSK